MKDALDIISNRLQIPVAGPSFLWSNDSSSDVDFTIVAQRFLELTIQREAGKRSGLRYGDEEDS
jgi:hypothetical protein